MKDTPTTRWVKTPEWLLDDDRVKDRDLRVYLTLARHASRTGRAKVRHATLAEEARVSVDTVKRALKRLREVAAVEWDERKFRQGANEYRLLGAPSEGASQPPHRGGTGAPSEGAPQPPPEVPTGLEPEVDEPDCGARYARTAEPEASVTTIDGGLFPEPERREPTPAELANECRKVWAETYTVHHGPPDPSLKRQAIGRIGQLAKDRTDVETWRALWQACHDAGAAGVWQVAQYLGPAPQSRYTQQTSGPMALWLERRAARPAGGPPWDGPQMPALNSLPASPRWTQTAGEA